MKQTAGDKPDNHDSTQTQGAERRECKRLNLAFPIEVSGFDSSGHLFCDRTVTNDVSDRGCRFDLLREVRCGVALMIQLIPPDGEQGKQFQPICFEVVWVVTSEWGWSIGASTLQPDNIWHMAFPKKRLPPDSNP